MRRLKIGGTIGIVVPAGNGKRDLLSQLHYPIDMFVDEDYSLYVSDYLNYLVMKWMKDAKEGIVVASGQSQENSLTQLSHLHGIMVDWLGNVCAADTDNYSITGWSKGSKKKGHIVVNEYWTRNTTKLVQYSLRFIIRWTRSSLCHR
jgi:hypothetical protein